MTNKLQSLLNGQGIQWDQTSTPLNNPNNNDSSHDNSQNNIWDINWNNNWNNNWNTEQQINPFLEQPQTQTSTPLQAQRPQVQQQTQVIDTSTIRSVRTSNVKYMIYIFIIVIAVIVFFPYAQGQYTAFLNAQKQITNLNNTIQTNITRQETIRDLIKLKTTTEQKITDIVDCINLEVGCGELGEEVTNQLDVVKDFLQLNNLDTEKMAIDERKILRNINEFLLQENPFEAWLNYNAKLNSLRIWDPEIFQWNISLVPLDMDITFADKEGLLSFINNVEKHIYAIKEDQTVNLDYALLYKITAINYDVVNYNQSQEVAVEMDLYYYQE